MRDSASIAGISGRACGPVVVGPVVVGLGVVGLADLAVKRQQMSDPQSPRY